MSEFLHNVGFWLPGSDVDHLYPELTPQELVYGWAEYVGKDSVETSSVLGAIALGLPESKRVASIDLCEVVRDTHVELANSVGIQRDEIPHFGQYFTTLGVERGDDARILTVLMNEVAYPPVDRIEEIQQILSDWGSRDILRVANTATLPGCEKVTLDFLTTHLPDCFDGIIFPRNHFGGGKITKASALETVLDDLGITETATTIVHVDDAPHHLDSMLGHMVERSGRSYTGIMPQYKGNTPPVHVVTASSPLEAFQIADIEFSF